MTTESPGEMNGEALDVMRVLYLGTPLFAKPTRRGATLAYLQDGTRLQVLGREKGFLRVRTERGGMGWVAVDSVSESESKSGG